MDSWVAFWEVCTGLVSQLAPVKPGSISFAVDADAGGPISYAMVPDVGFISSAVVAAAGGHISYAMVLEVGLISYAIDADAGGLISILAV